MENQFIQISESTPSLAEFIAHQKADAIFVLVDENTKKHCYPLIQEVIPNHYLIEITSGEKNKNLDTCQHIWAQLTQHNASRHALLINIGGGVIGDMGGFCAATYKRGIRFINIPTTLLAQVDASVGGKLGIDFMGFKNHIGVFQIPDLVYINPLFLKTLPPQELRSGFAEIIKHCLISDRAYWKKISLHDWKTQDWSAHIAHSVAFKKQITTEDPTEQGIRKILNFGHTVGHAIESYFLGTNTPLLHGEAIALGMVCEAHLSIGKCGLASQDAQEIERYVLENFPSIQLNESAIESISLWCLQDKKNKDGEVKMALISAIGKATWDIKVGIDEIKESLHYLKGIKKAG